MKLAIKGHPTRGKEVIEILEMLGGINELDLKGIEADSHYYVGNSINKIYRGLGICLYDYIIYSLEEFLEKFPYKVGDKVQHKGATSCGSIFEVEEMRWEENTVKYTLCLFGCNYKRFTLPAEYLQPYKEENYCQVIGNDTSSNEINTSASLINEETMEEKYIIKPTTEINLNHPCFDGHNEIELIIPNGWKFEQRGNKMFGIRKQYPKTYEECCEIVKVGKEHTLEGEIIRINNYKIDLLESFQKLLICRDAYWKIAGEEMGLDKPWKPDYDSGVNKYGIICMNGVVQESNPTTNWERHLNKIFDFPTEEMRDMFYENFKDLIEQCKELL